MKKIKRNQIKNYNGSGMSTHFRKKKKKKTITMNMKKIFKCKSMTIVRRKLSSQNLTSRQKDFHRKKMSKPGMWK